MSGMIHLVVIVGDVVVGIGFVTILEWLGNK